MSWHHYFIDASIYQVMSWHHYIIDTSIYQVMSWHNYIIDTSIYQVMSWHYYFIDTSIYQVMSWHHYVIDASYMSAPFRYQAIMWTNHHLVLRVWSLATHCSEIWIEIRWISIKKMNFETPHTSKLSVFCIRSWCDTHCGGWRGVTFR